MTEYETHMEAINRMNADIRFDSIMSAHAKYRAIACNNARMQRMTYGTRAHADTLAKVAQANAKAAQYLAKAEAMTAAGYAPSTTKES